MAYSRGYDPTDHATPLSITALSTMDPALIKRLVSHGMAVVEPGQSLMREGDKPDAFTSYSAALGRFRLRRWQRPAHEVNTVAESEILGEMGLYGAHLALRRSSPVSHCSLHDLIRAC